MQAEDIQRLYQELEQDIHSNNHATPTFNHQSYPTSIVLKTLCGFTKLVTLSSHKDVINYRQPNSKYRKIFMYQNKKDQLGRRIFEEQNT